VLAVRGLRSDSGDCQPDDQVEKADRHEAGK
jgi:hypothetical protein